MHQFKLPVTTASVSGMHFDWRRIVLSSRFVCFRFFSLVFSGRTVAPRYWQRFNLYALIQPAHLRMLYVKSAQYVLLVYTHQT